MRFVEAILAKVVAPRNRGVANGTQSRVKKRRDGAQRLKCAIDSHNAARQSLTPR